MELVDIMIVNNIRISFNHCQLHPYYGLLSGKKKNKIERVDKGKQNSSTNLRHSHSIVNNPYAVYYWTK